MACALPARWIKASVAPKLMPLLAPLILGVMACNPAAPRPDCADWNSSGFFEKASSGDVDRCLSEGVDPNARSEDGRTPLHFAAAVKSETPAVVKALLDAGADPNARGEVLGFTAFDLIKDDSPLQGTDVYWQLNDSHF